MEKACILDVCDETNLEWIFRIFNKELLKILKSTYVKLTVSILVNMEYEK